MSEADNSGAPVRAALVGLGEHGTEVLLPAMRVASRGRLVALCDSSEERRTSQAANISGLPIYASLEALLDEVEVEAVVMAGPPQMHHQLAMVALRRGVAVFVEKPPAADFAALQEVASLAQKLELITGVGLNFRYADPIRLIQRYIAEYDLSPIYVGIKHTSSKPRAGLWGLDRVRAFLLAQLIHPLDTLLLFGGGPVASVHTDAYARESDMTVSVSVRFESGRIGHLLVGTDSPKFESVLEVVTSEDVVFKLDAMWNLTVLDERRLPTSLPDGKRWSLNWSPSPLNSGFGRAGYVRELDEFFTCVQEGRQFHPSLVDALEIFEVIDQIDTSIRRLL